MARRYFDDRNQRQVPTEECTVLRVAGPLAGMTGRKELHLDKSNALALAVWLGYPVARPELETVPGPGPVAEPDPEPAEPEPDLDADATAGDLTPAALRVRSISEGTEAGSRPPARPPAPRRGA